MAKRKPTTPSPLEAMGFIRGKFDWEAEREIAAFGGSVRVLVEHDKGHVAPEQLQTLELLLATEIPLRRVAIHAAYERLVRWTEEYRKTHPKAGKVQTERSFGRDCILSAVVIPSPGCSRKPYPPSFFVSVYQSGDEHAYHVSFEWQHGTWVVTTTVYN